MGTRNALAAVALLFVVCVRLATSSDEPCRPGQVKMKECNTCRCTTTGIWGCTRMACPQSDKGGDGKVDVKRSAQQCVPNSTFRRACSSCACNADGTAALCKPSGCLPRRRRGVVCIAGKLFKRGCYLCRCLGDGSGFSCTVYPCPAHTHNSFF